jgi:hypothetical protein
MVPASQLLCRPRPCCAPAHMPCCLPRACSTDLTEGVRASARALASAESGLRLGADMAGKAVTGYVLPQARGGWVWVGGQAGGRRESG